MHFQRGIVNESESCLCFARVFLNLPVDHWPGPRRVARQVKMLHQKIMGILLSLHEKTTGPLQRVYELCLEAMNDNVSEDINAVVELPQIPFTRPILSRIEAALVPEPETEVETSSPEIATKRRKRKKKARKSLSVSESSTSTTNSKQKRQKGSNKSTKAYINQSTSSSSSVSSLPETGRQRVKCSLCNLWIEKYEMRQHKRQHHTDINPSPSVTRSVRPSRQAKRNGHQMSDFEYYWIH